MDNITKILKQYLASLHNTFSHGDAREESYYDTLKDLILQLAQLQGFNDIDITVLPKKTDAGNPDFRVWNGRNKITGYIEAKVPGTNLDTIEQSEQLKRYRETFPNLILTDFYEFRLYRDSEPVATVSIGRAFVSEKLGKVPPIEHASEFASLWQRFFEFSIPSITNSRTLAIELAKRTRFLRDQVIAEEMQNTKSEPAETLRGYYEAFKEHLIKDLTEQQFADLYAQTISYGLFVARTRADKEFSRNLAYDFIPRTIGLLRDIFRYISLGELPKPLEVIVDDIAAVLNSTDVKSILQEYKTGQKGDDPIIHFYETFLEKYDPSVRERRGVYYTPQPVVDFIVGAVNFILKNNFNLADGLANRDVKLLDPAGGTLTFPAQAIFTAAEEYSQNYGTGGLKNWIKNHILENFFAFELMMAPYVIGHLKMGFVLDELGYQMGDNERFKLYLTNTLEMEEIAQTKIPGLASLSKESHSAAQIKKHQPVLVIIGNPPYSGISANMNEWTERLLKDNVVEGVQVQSYYEVDGKPLGEKKLWLQDDYVKFLRFAQWKIQQAGHGIVGMITNHSYLDNPTFRGMRQSLMKTFDEIYILNLHGNSLKKETTPEGGKDENVFDIRQGVAIALFVKNKNPQKQSRVFYRDLYGTREHKYSWLKNTPFSPELYTEIKPASPWYFFIPRNTEKIKYYLKWKKINEIFPVNSVGIVTSRDNFVIDFDAKALENRVRSFKNSDFDDEHLHKFFNIRKKKGWSIRKAWQSLQQFSDSELKTFIVPLLYRPFDKRYIFYRDLLVERRLYKVMRHMLKENIGLTVGRQGKVVGENLSWNLVFISQNIIDFNLFYRGGELLFPLYVSPDESEGLFNGNGKGERKPNIPDYIFEQLTGAYGQQVSPEQILYYIYAVFYSNTYRTKYQEFLKIDFPRVPFTADYEVFLRMAGLGQRLADLHLLKSNELHPPVVKYQGTGDNDRIEKIRYDQAHQRVYINKDKYFEGISPQMWNYYIGGYQVLNKWLKDRKGRSLDQPELYTRIATAIKKTIDIQTEIDKIYPEVEKKMLDYFQKLD